MAASKNRKYDLSAKRGILARARLPFSGCMIAIATAAIFSSPSLAQQQAGEQRIVEKHPVLALPGKLDEVEVFNSNSPEVVQGDGILLSTFPPDGMKNPDAHLNHLLKGRVDFFLHQINNRIKNADLKKVELGLLVENRGKKPAHIRFFSGASYLSQPDAPFIDLPSALANDAGNVYAGPGDRVANDIMNKRLDSKYFPCKLIVQPGESAMIFQAAIPVDELTPPLNGRTTLFKIVTDEPIYAALMSKIADPKAVAPTLTEWHELLKDSGLVTPREKQPTPLDAQAMIYGRVSGVATGACWNAELNNVNGQKTFDVLRDEVFSTVIATVSQGTFGTGQVQSAPLVIRYPDTAFGAHGNYGIWYKISVPLKNVDSVPLKISVSLDTPIKNDKDRDTLQFFDTPAKQVFFRGTVRAEASADEQTISKVVHLVEHRGEKGAPLIEIRIPPKEKSDLKVDFVYPADATPPQVLTIRTEAVDEQKSAK